MIWPSSDFRKRLSAASTSLTAPDWARSPRWSGLLWKRGDAWNNCRIFDSLEAKRDTAFAKSSQHTESLPQCNVADLASAISWMIQRRLNHGLLINAERAAHSVEKSESRTKLSKSL